MSSRPRRTTQAIAGAVLAVAVLTGCGGLNPGVAFTIGDVSVKAADVDRLTVQYCQAVLDNAGEGQTVQAPLGAMRSELVQTLVLDEVLPEVLAEHGVSIDDQARQVGSEVETVLAGSPAELLEAVHAMNRVGLASQELAVAAVGEEAASSLDPNQLLGFGRQVLWAAAVERGVDINPRYGDGVTEQGMLPAEGSLSVAVSEAATGDPTQALPANQLCS